MGDPGRRERPGRYPRRDDQQAVADAHLQISVFVWMRIVRDSEHREVLLAQHHDPVRTLDELCGHLLAECQRDGRLARAV